MSLVPALQGRFVRRAHPGRAIAEPIFPASLLSDLLSDVRLSLRTFIKTPLLVIVTVLSLGVGIGVVTVAFALVNDLVVRPPVGLDAPNRLVTIYRSQENGRRYGGSSLPDYADVVGELDALSAVAEDQVEVGLGDTNSSCLIRGPDTENSRFVVMPMRL